jgi:type IV secretory pathway VirB10-like protein
MEVAKDSFKGKLRAFFLKDKIPFSEKRDVNWKAVKNCSIAAVVVGVVVVLLLPSEKSQSTTFHEKTPGSNTLEAPVMSGQDPTATTLKQLSKGAVSGSYRPTYGGGTSSGGGSGSERDASMILTRGGEDSKTQAPAGSRIVVHLIEKATVGTSGMPVIGIVSKDYVQGDTLAVPQGAKLFGQISFDADSDRAKVDWKAIELDGRQRSLSALAVGLDGQPGIDGDVHSDAVKNTVGAVATRFVGAYAEGSMERGAFGGNPGGSENGLKNAVSQVAQDRANAWGQDLQKEKRWIEVSPGTEFYAVLTANFVFRDPGATNGH